MGLRPAASRILLAALILAVSAGHAAAQIGRVGGIVRDDGGLPLKGATITAQDPNTGQSFTATTDDKGRFAMIGLKSAQWRFTAQAPGFLPQTGMMGVRAGAPNPPMTFTLNKGGVTAFGPLGGISGKDLQEELASADALYSQQKWDDAIEAYGNIASKSPALKVVNLQVASAYRSKKDYAGALAAYNRVLEANPDSDKAHVGIAMVHMERGDNAAAEAALMRAAEGTSPGRDVYFALGDLKLAKNDTPEAVRWYQKAATADPFWGKPLYQLGLCASKSGDTSGATRLMSEAIAVDPVSPEAGLAKSFLESLKK